MHLSREEFARDAVEFCRALAAVSTANHACENTASESSTSLTQWKLVQANIQGINTVYLTHAPVLRDVSETLGDDDTDDAFPLEDNLLIDTDITITTPPPLKSIWKFSIVYSNTWMVPVLYFSVTRTDTQMPLARTDILRMLDTNDIEDTWQFVSYEQHPITGEPACFLHPCQTAQRLDVLQKQHQDEQKVSSPILLWLSMMLPAVGFRIPSSTFAQLQQHYVQY